VRPEVVRLAEGEGEAEVPEVPPGLHQEVVIPGQGGPHLATQAARVGAKLFDTNNPTKQQLPSWLLIWRTVVRLPDLHPAPAPGAGEDICPAGG
jgi:hypothetical protein